MKKHLLYEAGSISCATGLLIQLIEVSGTAFQLLTSLVLCITGLTLLFLSTKTDKEETVTPERTFTILNSVLSLCFLLIIIFVLMSRHNM